MPAVPIEAIVRSPGVGVHRHRADGRGRVARVPPAPVACAVHAQHHLVAGRGRGARSAGAAARAHRGGARRRGARRTAARAKPPRVARGGGHRTTPAPWRPGAPPDAGRRPRMPAPCRAPRQPSAGPASPAATPPGGRSTGARRSVCALGPRRRRSVRPAGDREPAAAALGRAAEPVPDAIGAEVERLAGGLSLRRTPAVRVSDAIETPQVFGLLRPTVLLRPPRHGADPARAGDDAVPRTGARPAPAISPSPGRPPSWSASCSSTPEPGWRRANMRSRAKPRATRRCCSTSVKRHATTVGCSSASGSPGGPPRSPRRSRRPRRGCSEGDSRC